MRAQDWTGTPLGPPDRWPEGLKVPLRMMLTSRFEMWLGWGPELSFFYNDAYIPTLGVKHPHALGQPMSQVWKEVFEDVRDRIEFVMQGGIATWDKALLLLLERSGYPEETYHTFSYSPLYGAGRAVEGLMCVVTEETERVISERRLETLRVLGEALLNTRTRQDVLDGVGRALATNARDFPFHLVRLLDGSDFTGDGRLDDVAWPFERIADGEESVRIPLDGLLADPPCGAWEIAPCEALIVPITTSGQTTPLAALVLGLNPYRPEDREVAGFAQLIAS